MKILCYHESFLVPRATCTGGHGGTCQEGGTWHLGRIPLHWVTRLSWWSPASVWGRQPFTWPNPNSNPKPWGMQPSACLHLNPKPRGRHRFMYLSSRTTSKTCGIWASRDPPPPSPSSPFALPPPSSFSLLPLFLLDHSSIPLSSLRLCTIHPVPCTIHPAPCTCTCTCTLPYVVACPHRYASLKEVESFIDDGHLTPNPLHPFTYTLSHPLPSSRISPCIKHHAIPAITSFPHIPSRPIPPCYHISHSINQVRNSRLKMTQRLTLPLTFGCRSLVVSGSAWHPTTSSTTTIRLTLTMKNVLRLPLETDFRLKKR